MKKFYVEPHQTLEVKNSKLYVMTRMNVDLDLDWILERHLENNFMNN
jgi:hypothetical protein